MPQLRARKWQGVTARQKKILPQHCLHSRTHEIRLREVNGHILEGETTSVSPIQPATAQTAKATRKTSHIGGRFKPSVPSQSNDTYAGIRRKTPAISDCK